MVSANKNHLDALHVMLGTNIPVKLESLPGAGKTSYLNALVGASDGYIHTMVAVNHDPTDFGGIPVPNVQEGTYDLLPGQWVEDLAASVDTHPLSVWFLDEVNTAGRAVMAALLKGVDERIIGNRHLPPEVRVVLAVNPAEANGGVDLPPAMANRVAHLPFGFNAGDWGAALKAGFPPPAPLRLVDETDGAFVALLQETRLAVAEFAGSTKGQDAMNAYPEDMVARSKAWPSFRSWTLAAKALAGAQFLGFSPAVQETCVASLVGGQAADLFDDYKAALTLLNPDDLLNDPDGFPLPEKDDELFATVERAVDVALQRGDQKNLDAICQVLMRLASDGRPGVGASAMRNVATFLTGHRDLLGPVQQMTIREFRKVVDALAGMDFGKDAA